MGGGEGGDGWGCTIQAVSFTTTRRLHHHELACFSSTCTLSPLLNILLVSEAGFWPGDIGRPLVGDGADFSGGVQAWRRLHLGRAALTARVEQAIAASAEEQAHVVADTRRAAIAKHLRVARALLVDGEDFWQGDGDWQGGADWQ